MVTLAEVYESKFHHIRDEIEWLANQLREASGSAAHKGDDLESATIDQAAAILDAAIKIVDCSEDRWLTSASSPKLKEILDRTLSDVVK